MKLLCKAISVAFLKMSQPKNKNKEEDVASTVAAVPVEAEADLIPTFGVEVVGTKAINNDTQQVQDGIQIKIHPFQFLRDLTRWMKEYHVGKTLREWARQIEWKEQVWTPLKDWAREVKWEEEFWNPLREWFKGIKWREMRKEIKEAMQQVDWKETRNELKEGIREVDWKELRQQMNEASQDVDWKQVREEVKDGLREVNWDHVRKEAKEFHAEWNEVKSEFKDDLKQAIDLGKEVQDEIPVDVDWEMIYRGLQDVCPDQLDAEQTRKSIAGILQPDAELEKK